MEREFVLQKLSHYYTYTSLHRINEAHSLVLLMACVLCCALTVTQ